MDGRSILVNFLQNDLENSNDLVTIFNFSGIVIHTGSRIILGKYHVFRYNDPQEARQSRHNLSSLTGSKKKFSISRRCKICRTTTRLEIRSTGVARETGYWFEGRNGAEIARNGLPVQKREGGIGTADTEKDFGRDSLEKKHIRFLVYSIDLPSRVVKKLYAPPRRQWNNVYDLQEYESRIKTLENQVDLARSMISDAGSNWEGERFLTSSLMEFAEEVKWSSKEERVVRKAAMKWRYHQFTSVGNA